MLNAALDFSCSELSFAAVDGSGQTLASFQVDLPGRDSSSLPILVGEALTKVIFAICPGMSSESVIFISFSVVVIRGENAISLRLLDSSNSTKRKKQAFS